MDEVRQPTAWGPRVLVLVALAGPLWASSWGPAQLTVGRVLLLVLAAAVAVDLVPVRGRLPRPAWAVAGLVGALGALLAWSVVSGALWGAFSGGVAQGFGELVVLTGLVGVVGLYAAPRQALMAVGAATLGVLAGGLLAAAGVKDLHAAAYAASASVSRLDGVYGNANFLGTALALALPAAAAAALRWRGRARIAAGVTALALLGLLLATFSRGALLAAAIGVPVALVLASRWRPSRRTTIAVAVVVPLVAALLIASPFYRSQRITADFGSERVTSVADVDRSGWFTGRSGPVRVAGATLSNPPGTAALRVDAARPGQGVSLDLGEAFGTARAGWSFTAARGEPGAPLTLRWRVESTDSAPGGPGVEITDGTPVAEGTVVAGATPRPVDARFASAEGTRYVLYAWTPQAGPFVLDDVRLFEHRPETVGGTRPLPTELLGPAPDALRDAQGLYERSRWAGVRLAGEGFLAQPVRGLGLGMFPAYADRHGRYGPLPTHNAYAQVVAELGLIGLIALVAAITTLVAALRRGRPPVLLRAAIVGTLVTGAVVLLFINGLSSPGMMMPLVVAIGLSVAWAGPRPRGLRLRRQTPREA